VGISYDVLLWSRYRSMRVMISRLLGLLVYDRFSISHVQHGTELSLGSLSGVVQVSPSRVCLMCSTLAQCRPNMGLNGSVDAENGKRKVKVAGRKSNSESNVNVEYTVRIRIYGRTTTAGGN
jgi:hypothetical protein